VAVRGRRRQLILKILFVAFGSSPHTARWINQLSGENWDLHLFPVDEYYLYPGLRDVTVHTLFPIDSKELDASVRQANFWWPFRRGRRRMGAALQRLPGEPMSAPARLARLIRSLKPDIVHSLEMQHGAYLTLAGRERLNGSFPPWMYSSWGSDIYYFGKQPEHEARIRSVLSACDYLMGDSQRDLNLAAEFGFKGETLGVYPSAGGFEIDQMRKFRKPGPVSARKIIALKGRQELLGGRALVALQAVHLCADVLGEYEIVIYMPQGDSIVTYAAQYISFVTGLNIRVLPEHRPHEEILTMMGNARIAIGLGVTDGTPPAMLEAMVMGAFPIQSDSAATEGYIEDGINGLLVPAEDADVIAAAIRKAVSDDEMVNQAGEKNAQLTRERLDESVIKPRVIAAYQMVAANQKARGGR
jgi:glycosyltransferase involved in cell wall biosynthesis